MTSRDGVDRDNNRADADPYMQLDVISLSCALPVLAIV
jgi:hypothetical protein